MAHLQRTHTETIGLVAGILPECYSREERFAAAYSEAIATIVRKGALTALYSIYRRCLFNYATSCREDQVEAPICFFCACVYPRLAKRRSNEIRWVQPFDGHSKLCSFGREQAEEIFSIDKFLERYGRCDKGVPDLTLHPDEFDDWVAEVPFAGGAVRIICCPEDKLCGRVEKCGPTELCASCQVPVCRDCESDLYGPEPKMPARCLANDLMVFYAPKEIFTEQMSVLELMCCSVCITSMICFSLEVKYGNLFDTTVHMQRHRVGARGTATTFPLPWQQLLAELMKLDDEQEQGKGPDVPKVGADLVHVVQVLLKTSDDSDDKDILSRFIHQARVRRQVVVRSILDAKARGHRSYVRVDAARVQEKASMLPEDGVPPELMHLLPNDNSISKLQVQKAATPVEGLRSTEDVGRAIAAQRPNAVVLEKSGNDDGGHPGAQDACAS